MDGDELEVLCEDKEFVKECVRAAVDPLKPIFDGVDHGIPYFKCGHCHKYVYREYQYCVNCGHLIDKQGFKKYEV